MSQFKKNSNASDATDKSENLSALLDELKQKNETLFVENRELRIQLQAAALKVPIQLDPVEVVNGGPNNKFKIEKF